jgi:MSHA biogenesis protein MshI
VLEWFRTRRSDDAWLAITLGEEEIPFAVGRYEAPGEARISQYGVHAADDLAASVERWARSLGLDRHQCETLLHAGEYQLLQVEPLNVPPAELKSAVRWRIKDMLDYHVDDATIDVLQIPSDPSSPGRSHGLYAVAARNEVIESSIRRFEAARLPLTVVDIPETAQRNIAALYETEGRALAMLFLEENGALLTINFRGELYLARRFEVGLAQLRRAAESARAEAAERLVLEAQRTFDHFERQYSFAAVAGLMLAPQPEETGLAEALARRLGIPVASVDLAQKLAFDGVEPPTAAMQWRLFHLIGATLRQESKAL